VCRLEPGQKGERGLLCAALLYACPLLTATRPCTCISRGDISRPAQFLEQLHVPAPVVLPRSRLKRHAQHAVSRPAVEVASFWFRAGRQKTKPGQPNEVDRQFASTRRISPNTVACAEPTGPSGRRAARSRVDRQPPHTYNPTVAIRPTDPIPTPTGLSTGLRLDPLDDARFVPGRIFASRYRIVVAGPRRDGRGISC